MPNRIRRWVETDTGHRVPNHSSKCRHMHGHRYRWEAELEGDVVTKRGVSEEGNHIFLPTIDVFVSSIVRVNFDILKSFENSCSSFVE